MFWTVIIDRYARAGDSRIPCLQFNETIVTSKLPYIQDHFCLKIELVAKSTKIAISPSRAQTECGPC